MARTVLPLLAALGALCLIDGNAVAHHSVAGQFDQSQRTEITGVISKVDWINPHVYIQMDVPDEKGAITTWRLESLPTAMLRKAGLTSEMLKGGGQKVTAYTKLNKFPKTKALATDLIKSPTTVSHYGAGERIPSWNVLYADGHVTLSKAQILIEQMKKRGSLSDDQGNPSGPSSNTNWALMDDYRDILETIADGRDPRVRQPWQGSDPYVNRVRH